MKSLSRSLPCSAHPSAALLALCLAPSLAACHGGAKDDTAGAPLGITLAMDDQLYAGVARMEITPEIVETYVDANGNNQFDGCMTDPTGTRPGCNNEGYDDVNGNAQFDGVWIAGYQSGRAAMGVHDPITVGAVVLSLNEDYVALVGVDVLGLLENRTRDIRDVLEAEGFDRNHLIISSSHSHSAPDSVGIWGLDEKLIPGTYAPFMDAIEGNIADTIRLAAADMVPVSPTQGLVHMSDDPTLNGAPFGGVNPNDRMLGGINDIRDPIIPADAVWALALDGADGRVATVVSSSGHPEVSGSDHSQLSADFVGYTRDYIDSADGGTTVYLSGALGGMQSASGSTLPMVDESGARLLDENGDPTWMEDASGFEGARTWGVLVAQAAQAALTDATPWTAIDIRWHDVLIPVNNISFKLAFLSKLIDTPDEYVVQDSSCPGWGTDNDLFGCVPGAVWQIGLGPSTLASAPGELMPELFYGVPDEAAMADASLRPTDRRWVQASDSCATVDYADCKDKDALNGCDCLHAHAAPYRISDNGVGSIESMIPGTYKVPLGITNAYCGYIVPAPDFNTYVSVLTDDGDHYEETNSCSKDFGNLIQDAWLALEAGQ